MDIDWEEDFGFSSIEAVDIDRASAQKDKEDLAKLDKMIKTLLDNLESGTGEYIHWPNRKERIASFKRVYNETMNRILYRV